MAEEINRLRKGRVQMQEHKSALEDQLQALGNGSQRSSPLRSGLSRRSFLDPHCNGTENGCDHGRKNSFLHHLPIRSKSF
jgi:hypothetical protein